MQGKTRERWQDLCAKAAEEQDPVKLMRLISEINQLLEEKEQRLKRNQTQGSNVQSRDAVEPSLHSD